MAESIPEIIAGRKVFFITPDSRLIPKSFCEDYLAEGYECYFVENDKRIPLKAKIDIIIGLFKDVILFFNVDAEIKGISWPSFVSNLYEKTRGRVPIGCLFGKRPAKNEKLKIERKYLYDLGLVCGCIQLDYQKKMNFEIIAKVLYAFQATGRRKNVRAIGNSNCTFSFSINDINYSGTLKDVSLSHFSFIYPDGKLRLKEYEKIDGISFIVKGCHFTSSAVLFMQRETERGEKLFVFTFIGSSGTQGLDQATKQRFTPFLYQLMSENCQKLLDGLYQTYADKHMFGNYDDDDDDEVIPLFDDDDDDGLEEL